MRTHVSHHSDGPQTAREGASSSASADEFLRFSQLWRIVKHRKKLLAAVCGVVVLGTVVGHFLSLPQFSADAAIQLPNQASSFGESLLENGSMRSQQDEVIEDYLYYLKSDPFYLSLAGTIKFAPEFDRLNLMSRSQLGLFSKAFWQRWQQHYLGASQKEQPGPVTASVEEMAGLLKSILKISSIGATIRVQATTLDPFTSVFLVNSAVKEFTKMTNERDHAEVKEVQAFVAEKLVETEARLKRSEIELVNFKKQHNIVEAGSPHFTSDELTRVENLLQGAQLQYNENAKLIAHHQKSLQAFEQNVMSAGAGASDLASRQESVRLRQRFDDLHRQKVLLASQGYGDGDWRIKQVNDEIDKVASEMKNSRPDERSLIDASLDPKRVRAKIQELSEQNRDLENKIANFTATKTKLFKDYEGIPKTEQEFLNLQRAVELEYEIFSTLKKKQSQLEIQKISLQKKGMRMELMSGLPGPSPRPSLFLKLVFSVLVGLFSGTLAAVMIELLDGTVKYRSDLEDFRINVLGEIPEIKRLGLTRGSRRSKDDEALRTELMVCRNQSESLEAMAFKYLRARLASIRNESGRPIQSIAITSAQNGDGKSLVAANLAVSLAQINKKTVLIDADMRKPSLPLYFNYQKTDGLSDLISLRRFLDEILIKNAVKNLDIIPSGLHCPNPTELISSDKFSVLLRFLHEHYDYIIVDCPPTNSMVDAAIVARQSDSVILVASHRQTSKEGVRAAYRRIRQISHKPVYGVFNNVEQVDHFLYDYGYSSVGSNGQAFDGHFDNYESLRTFQDNLNRQTGAL